MGKRVFTRLGAPLGHSGHSYEPTLPRKQLLEFYERLYFHEIDARESLSSRLQIPLAITVSLFGVVAYLLQKFEFSGWTVVSGAFSALLCGSVVLLCGASYNFVRSYYDHTYNFVPSAQECENYYKQLMATYADYSKSEQTELVDKYFCEYLFRYFIDCSSNNSRCNDTRSLYLHRTNGFIIQAAVVLFFGFGVFYFGRLDKDQTKQPTEVSVVGPVTLAAPGTPPTVSPVDQLAGEAQNIGRSLDADASGK